MDFSMILEDSEVLSPPRSSNSEIAVQRNRFHVALPHEERFISQPSANANKDQEVTMPYLLELYGGIMAAIERVEAKVDRMEKAIAEKMPERSEVQAQGQLLRECRVVTSKVHQSISRITGDGVSKEYTLLQSMLPLSSQENLNTLEDLLRNKPHSDAMLNIIFKMKGAKGCVKQVLRSIFTDNLLSSYNFEGKAKKAPLLGLKTTELIFDAFGNMARMELIAEIRKHVFLSHNRYKQVVLKNKLKNNINNQFQ